MYMAETEIVRPAFEFTGNRLCLDFANTVHDRASNPQELLNSYKDLLTWGREAHLLSAPAVAMLSEKASGQPQVAAIVLERALDLREAMFRIFAAQSGGAAPAGEDLSRLNRELARALGQLRLVRGQEDYTWDWTNQEQELDSVLWPVVRSAAEMLTSAELYDVRICASDNCSWLFLDTSKNHSRRWCDMKSCGNRAKARRHYNQKKQAI
jgi:predicted RNA-binding Zn ribbon-like protein